MSRVILGGGISGLSAAYYLCKSLPNQAPILVEASNRLGGWIKSTIVDDYLLLEQGPRTIRPKGPAGFNTLSLIDELGISDQIWPITSSHPTAWNRMIYAKGQLHTLPSSLISIFKTQPPLSKPVIKYLMQDIFATKRTVEDESIYDFTSRRFGAEFADYFISAMICGICAGDAKEISVKFLLKQFFEYEQKYGSITRGLARNMFKKSKPSVPLQGLSLRAKQESWQMFSFQNGVETLPRALEAQVRNCGAHISLNSKCTRLELKRDGAVLHLDNGKQLSTEHVISALPAENLGAIVKTEHPDLANLLCDIKAVNVGVVNLCYEANLIKKEGFGFLVPPKENVPILGVTYDSCCFRRSDGTQLSVMMGGRWFEQLFGTDPTEDVLLRIAKEQVGRILDIHDEPIYFKVNILKKCIPQYVVGHTERVGKIEKYIGEKNLPLSLCGASYYGVSVNDAIVSGKEAVRRLST